MRLFRVVMHMLYMERVAYSGGKWAVYMSWGRWYKVVAVLPNRQAAHDFMAGGIVRPLGGAM